MARVVLFGHELGLDQLGCPCEGIWCWKTRNTRCPRDTSLMMCPDASSWCLKSFIYLIIICLLGSRKETHHLSSWDFSYALYSIQYKHCFVSLVCHLSFGCSQTTPTLAHTRTSLWCLSGDRNIRGQLEKVFRFTYRGVGSL